MNMALRGRRAPAFSATHWRLPALVLLSSAALIASTAVGVPPGSQIADASAVAATAVTLSTAVQDGSGCQANTLAANDDGSTGEVQLPFTINFFGNSYSNLWVNNNGNVTFDGPLNTYTPFSITSTTPPIIAPFLADVDTRGPGSGLVTYGTTTFEGHSAFCVEWPDVGYFASHTDKLNDFELLLVDRPDVALGDFDIVFNYDQIQWETGDASGGTEGLAGTSATVGFSNGAGGAGDYFELAGSLVNGAFLDSNTQTGLIYDSVGSTVPGQYIFHITGSYGSGGSTTGLDRQWPPSVGFGYSFDNHGLQHFLDETGLSVTDVITPAEMEHTFSDWGRDPASAGLGLPAMNELVSGMDGGMCFGFALSGGRFDGQVVPLYSQASGRTDSVWQDAGTGPSASMSLPEPGQNGSSYAYNRQMMALLAEDFVTQYSTQVNTSLQLQHYAYADPTGGFTALEDQLVSVMGSGVNLYDSSGELSTPSGNGFAMITLQTPVPGTSRWYGHEVLAYSLSNLSDGGLAIGVWDNNFENSPTEIDVHPDGSWTYSAVYPQGDYSGTLSMSGQPGDKLGLLAVLPLFDPAGLSFYPQANGGLGQGSLVDVPAGVDASATDANGDPVDVEAVTSDALTTAAGGEVIDLPSDAGQVTLTGTAVSIDIRGPSAYMSLSAPSATSATPLTVSEDDQAGSIQATGVAADMSVARGDIVINSTGAGGLTVGPDGSVGTSDDSANVDLQVQFVGSDGNVDTASLYSGTATSGGGLSFTPQQVATATDNTAPPSVGGGGGTPTTTTTVPTTTTAPTSTTTTTPSQTTTTAAATRAAHSASVSIVSVASRGRGAQVDVSLACRGASACAGMVTLDRRSGRGPALAQKRYSLRNDKQATVVLRPRAAVVLSARRHPVAAVIKVSVSNGKTAARTMLFK
jgi:hypothetical protein